VTITPAPTLQRLVTYWLAPWQALTAGGVPSRVDVKICTLDVPDPGRRTCQRYREVWEVIVVTATATTSRAIELLTTLTGPGTLVVQTVQSYITDTVVTVDLSTTLLLETEREVESTSVSVLQREVAATTTPAVITPTETRRSTSTRYITKHLELRPSVTSVSEEPTTTVQVTSTSTVTRTGTLTITRVRTGTRARASSVDVRAS
jgi:hypothetical protein